LTATSLDYCIKRGKEIASTRKIEANFHYAVVCDSKGRVLGESENKFQKSHPLQAKYARLSGNPDKQFLHAEVAAIIRAARGGKPHTIYVVRIGKRGNLMYSQPCPSCALAIKEAGIKVVVFSTGE